MQVSALSHAVVAVIGRVSPETPVIARHALPVAEIAAASVPVEQKHWWPGICRPFAWFAIETFGDCSAW